MGTNYEEARRVDVGRIQAARLWFLIMNMVLFHPSVTLLLFVTNSITTFAAAANIEGEILHSLRMNLIDPNNVMQNWDPTLPSPCTWFHVTCNSDGSVVRIDLGNAALSGQLVPQLGQLKNLQYLKLYGNNLSGPIFYDLGNLKSLVSLDLYSNCLSGFIPHTLGKLRKLRFLRLNDNHLTGSIPMSLTHVTGLQILDLSNNHLSGPVPENGSFSLLILISSNNLDLCGRVIGKPCPGSHFPPFNPSSPGSIPSRTGVITGVAAGAALLFSASALGLAWWFQQMPQDQFFDVPAEEDSEVCLRQLKRFYLQELQVATNSFSDINVLWRGESSEVYKGCLANGNFVAVKRLQGDKPATLLMFQTEIKVIGMAVHRNVSTLYGFCITPTNFFLIYPYMANGSVASCLRERAPNVPPLDWATRKQIALGAARGLSYLHVHCEPKIIHLNVKLSNILLDEKFEAIIGDFRIAEFMDYKCSHMRSVVKGTSGYVAPEYTCRGKFSEKCDVYAYGMMLLELTTGQKIHDLLHLAKEDGENLLEQKKFDMMVDPDICIEPEVEHMIQIAVLCSQVSPSHRPNMSEVVRMLEGDNLLKTWESLKQEIGSIPSSQYLWTMDSSDNMDMEISDVQLSGNKTSRIGIIIGGVAAGVALLFAILAIGFTWFRQWKLQEKFFDVVAANDPEVHLGHLKRFSLRELQVATDNFNDKNILGRGGFGKVFKGCLADGSLVAVKRLKEEHTQGKELQFQTEIEMISVAVHQNLLCLRGFCMTSTERLLVYPYMANGSVASCLRKHRQNEPPLDWPTRRRIALGSAKGLDFLHDHCEPKIIHRDVKAANILLDEEFEAVVGDFGLAKLMGAEDTHVTTAVRGTIGHIAPEYLATGKASEKTDVFGYGIMLLELITGQSAFDLARLANDGNTMLFDWVEGILKENNLEMLVDQNLQNNYIYSEVEQLIQLALICTQDSEICRPKMSEVLRLLEGDGLAEKWEEWQTVEHVPAYHWNSEWIVDSIENLSADELSGPR